MRTALARGVGTDVAVSIGVGLGVTVDVAVELGVTVAVSVGVGLGVTVDVAVELGIIVAVLVAVAVRLGAPQALSIITNDNKSNHPQTIARFFIFILLTDEFGFPTNNSLVGFLTFVEFTINDGFFKFYYGEICKDGVLE